MMKARLENERTIEGRELKGQWVFDGINQRQHYCLSEDWIELVTLIVSDCSKSYHTLVSLFGGM